MTTTTDRLTGVPGWVRELARSGNVSWAESFWVPGAFPDFRRSAPAFPPAFTKLVWIGVYVWADVPRPEVWAADATGRLWVRAWERGSWGPWVRQSD